MGPAARELRDAHDTVQGYKCLLSRGLIRAVEDMDRELTTYYLTPLGVREVAKLHDQEVFKFGKPNKNQHVPDVTPKPKKAKKKTTPPTAPVETAAV